VPGCLGPDTGASAGYPPQTLQFRRIAAEIAGEMTTHRFFTLSLYIKKI